MVNKCLTDNAKGRDADPRLGELLTMNGDTSSLRDMRRPVAGRWSATCDRTPTTPGAGQEERFASMIDIYQIPAILKKRIGWLIVLPILFVTLATVFLALRTPVYRAMAEMLIEPQGLQIVGNDIVAREGGDALQRLSIDSQAYVILSNAVLNEVIDKLDLESDPAITRPVGPGLLGRLLGESAATPSADDIRAAAVAGLRESLQAIRIEKAFVFNIYASHPDRFKAAAIANEAARAYLDEARRSRADTALRASMALQTQAEDLRKRVEQAEAAVENFRAENGLISTGQRGLVVDQQLQDFNTQLTQARVEMEKAKANADLLKNLTVTDIEAGGLPTNLQTTTLGTLRVQYARIAEREAQAATTLGASHPQLRELRSQLDNTRRQIADELARVRRSVTSEYQRAEANVAALQEEASRLSSSNVSQSKSQIRLRQLESEADSLNAVYKSFLSRAKELEEQQEIDTTNSRVISRAVAPLKPTGPSGIIVLLAAGFFGFAVAAAGSVGWEMVNGKLGSERELVERTGVPLIASLRAPGRAGQSGRLARLLPGGDDRAEAAERQLAVARIAYALRHAFEGERPAHVLVLAAGEETPISPLVRAIATGLYDMGEDVLLAHTDQTTSTAALAPPPAASPGRSRLSSLRRETQASVPAAVDHGPFAVERLDGRERPIAGLREAEEDEFLVIDGGSVLANPYLPVLLGYSDAILLVTSVGETSRRDLDRALTLLQPWQDRMIGNVALAA
jgi:uncharacterized protein involved in exopolysaccharide biosynthesis